MDNKELGKLAKGMHADFFDHCNDCIKNGAYLEALLLEYTAIEGRMSRIMEILGMPCSTCDNAEKKYAIGLRQKAICLHKFVKKKDKLFEKTYLSDIGGMIDWCGERNERIHRYFSNPIRYLQLKEQNEYYATEGLKYARAFYDEENRLKRIQKHHPELLQQISFKCKPRNNNAACKDIKDYVENEQDRTEKKEGTQL